MAKLSHSRRRAWAGILIALAVPAPALAQPPRVLILELEPVTLPAPHDKTKLGQELRSALTAAGCEVVRVCHTLNCQDAAKDVDVLSFTGRYQPSSFSCGLKVQLRRAGGGDSSWSTDNPVCPAARLVDDTREAGRRACEELRGSAVRGAQPTTPASAPAATTTNLVASAQPASTWTAGRWLGVSALVAGLGLGTLGVIQMLENGDPTRCSTSSQGDTVCTGIKRRPLAIPLIAVGAVGVGWGLWQTLGLGVEHSEGLTLVTARGRY
jgi:hypothetical protein